MYILKDALNFVDFFLQNLRSGHILKHEKHLISFPLCVSVCMLFLFIQDFRVMDIAPIQPFA